MTTPGGSAPDGAYVVGSSYGSDVTESSAMAMATGGAKNSWSQAQENQKVNTAGMFREVTRLDNRIDTFLYGSQMVNLATFSESGWWTKPPGAKTVTIDVMAGSSGGGSENGKGNRTYIGGAGGFSGGWSKATVSAEDLPDEAWVEVGGGAEGAAIKGPSGGAGGSAFGDLLIAEGATGVNYGVGNFTFRIRGGNGGYGDWDALWGITPHASTPGGEGSFHTGGEAGSPIYSGNPGVNGYSVAEVGRIGMGSGGGGGALSGDGSGGRGGDGGWPAGPGGGEGGFSNGGGGNGAVGAVFVMTVLEDTLGLPPTPPTDLVAVLVEAKAVSVSWTASTDDIAVRSYEVFVDGRMDQSTDGVEARVTGLAAATTYEITVQAIDIGGNRSEMSVPLSVVTIV